LALDLTATDLQHITSSRPIADAALALDFALSDAELNILDGLPALRRLSVEGRSTGTRVSLASRQGRLEMPDGRRLAFLDGSYEQSGLDKPGSIARIGFRLDGGADAMASLLRQPTFGNSPVSISTLPRSKGASTSGWRCRSTPNTFRNPPTWW
jgi:hypothetical protein